MAESENLEDWTRHPNPIIDLGDSAWEEIHVADPHVIFFKGKYLMYYMGKGNVWQVGLAESSDGIEWYKHDDNPIINASEEWCDGCVSLSGIIQHNENLIATIHGYDSKKAIYTVRMFKSKDGIKWKEMDMPPIEPTDWCNRGIVHPEPLLIKDKLYIFFTGIRVGKPNLHRVGRVVYDEEEIRL